jgi:vacuolar-type H+-ATPase subunit E/Vma4
MKKHINIEAIRRVLESIFRELQEKLDIITKKPQLRTSKHPVRGQLNIYRYR